MQNISFSSWPCYSNDEAEAVQRVLLSNRVNYWTGDVGREFEREFARAVESQYAVAVANGTVALELALRGLGIGAGDEVIVTSRTFLASVSCIVAVGAVPIFADVERDSQTVSLATVSGKITSRTRAVIAVHLAGWPCEMDELMTLSRHGIHVIEDCAQAHGARYRQRSVGSIGEIGCWSFCQDKIISTGGEGGMVTTNNADVWRRMWAYKDHGKSWEAVYEREHPPGFRWVHESFGTNWRLTEMQAAIGLIQLRRLPEWSVKRRANAERIWSSARACLGLRVPDIPIYVEHAAYKCYVFVELSKLKSGWSRDRVIAEITSRGVPCYCGSCSEVYSEMAFEGTGLQPDIPLPVARELGETSLMFLCHPNLTDEELDKTCRVLAQVMAEATDELTTST